MSRIDYVVDTVPTIGLDIEKPMAWFGCGLNVHPQDWKPGPYYDNVRSGMAGKRWNLVKRIGLLWILPLEPSEEFSWDPG